MPAIRKTYAAKVLPASAGADEAGTFEAIVAVFGNVDRDGDIVEKGAFEKSLLAWAAKGSPIPMLWSHQAGDPDNVLGYFLEAKETADGLWVKGVFDLEHPRAARVYKLMQQGLIAEFSWWGEVLKFEWIEAENPEDWYFAGMRIQEVDLWEAGPCFKGANPDTELISLKAADLTGQLGERIRRQGKTATEPSAGGTPAPGGTPEPEPTPVAPESAPAGDAPDGTADDQSAPPEDVQRPNAAMKARALLSLATTTN